MQRLLLARP